MSDLRAQVREQLSQLERVQTELAAVAGRTDGARRAELIQLRRELAQQIGRMGEAAQHYFQATEDSELMRQIRIYYSEMRTRAAMR